MGHQSLHQIGDARAINAGSRHNIGLAKAVRPGDRLQNDVLEGSEGGPGMAGEHCVRALSGSVQEMQQRLQRRSGRRGTLRHESRGGQGRPAQRANERLRKGAAE